MQTLQYISIPSYTTASGELFSKPLSYQVFGKAIGTAPVVCIVHALTGKSDVAGPQGWWKTIVGSQKSIDTDRYTVLCFDTPGNGYDTKESQLISNYKAYTARDIAHILAKGIDKLGIKRLYCMVGVSHGGGIVWEFAAAYPDLCEVIIPIASDWKATDWLVANCFIQDSILQHSQAPLFDARLHAMTLYRTPESLTQKFQRSLSQTSGFEVESWLNHHGHMLNERFELSAYRLMNQLLKTIDVTRDRGSVWPVLAQIKSHIHIITIDSDLFFKAEENWATYVELKALKDNVSIGEIKSIHGHDAFLIEDKQVARLLKPIFNPKHQHNENYTHHHIWNR